MSTMDSANEGNFPALGSWKITPVKSESFRKGRDQTMRSVAKFLKKLQDDKDGASLIEYTVLLAILLIAVITIIAAVGGWINNTWSNLNAALP